MVDKSRNAPIDQDHLLDDADFVYRSSFVTKDGRRIYARDYGLKAFRFPRRY